MSSDSQARAAATVYISALRTTRFLRPQVQGSATQGSNSYPTAVLCDGNSVAANLDSAFLSTACHALRLRRDGAAEALEQLLSAGGTSGYNDTEIYDGGGSAFERLHLASLSQFPTPDVRWAAAWLPARAMLLQGGFDAHSAWHYAQPRGCWASAGAGCVLWRTSWRSRSIVAAAMLGAPV
mmetsp:Transcript_3647/g.11571  ORF Transcript_3647/g.11571 Transcript_3647/m.11571 type:complete len:181 (+) Transcript_3647:241-783(+)